VGAGDFLQGVAAARFGPGAERGIALSWHAPGHGVQMLIVPADPMKQPWSLHKIADVSQDEALSAGDIAGHGRPDLLQGTRWLRNRGANWESHVIDPDRGNPERNRLAGINGDGRLDAVVGFEAISAPGDVVWYEMQSDPSQPWRRHHVATVIGPMSLDVGDLDCDGDPDIVVGEHNLKEPERSRLLLFENVNGKGGQWKEHVVFVGDGHHDGALLVDLDRDGDLDIVSIGWSHGRVLWYEQLGRPCASGIKPRGASRR
jgi:hypothetical protein